MLTSASPAKRLINRRAVGDRYGGRTARTVKRWIDQGLIPPPDLKLHGRDYWNETTLDDHDRQRADAGANYKNPINNLLPK